MAAIQFFALLDNMHLRTASDLYKRLIGTLVFIPFIVLILLGDLFAALGLALLALWLAVEFAVLMMRTDQLRYPGLASKTAIIMLMIASWGAGYIQSTESYPYYWVIASSLVAIIGVGVLFQRLNLFALCLMGCLFALGVLSVDKQGVECLIFLACIITASDVCAYLSGRAIGGAKLAPAVSPSKTWSGSAGGLIGAMVTGAAGLYFADAMIFAGFASVWIAMLAIICAGILGQAGDLYESWYKRTLNVKDSSDLIPGHGGVLDRFDGYLFAVPVLAIWLSVN